MKFYFISLISLLLFTGCSIKQNPEVVNSDNIKKLSLQIQSLSKTVDKEEAKRVSYDLINYSKQLAKEYKVNTTALFHNTLINLNIKKRGLCYHYANDLLSFLRKKDYKSFKFIKAIANRDEYFEHTSLVLTTKNTKFENSIILDAWRNTGELYFSKVKDDKRYEWERK